MENLNILYFLATVIVILFIIKYWLNKIEDKTKTSEELFEWLKDLWQRVEKSTS